MNIETTFAQTAYCSPSARAKEIFPPDVCLKSFELDALAIGNIEYVEQQAVPFMQSACVAIFDEASTLSPWVGPTHQIRDLRVERNLFRIEKAAIEITDCVENMSSMVAHYAARGLDDKRDAVLSSLRRLSSALNADHLPLNEAARKQIREVTAPVRSLGLSARDSSTGFASAITLACAARRELADEIALAEMRNPAGRPKYASQAQFITILAEIFWHAFSRKPAGGPGNPTSRLTDPNDYQNREELLSRRSNNSPFCRFVEAVYCQMQINLNASGHVEFACPSATTIATFLNDARNTEGMVPPWLT